MSLPIAKMTTAEARFPSLPLGALRQAVLADAVERGMGVLEDCDARLSIQAGSGVLTFEVAENGVVIRIAAPRPERLQALRDLLMTRMTTLAPAATATARWSDAPRVDARPPNLRQAKAVSIDAVGPSFLRVRLALPDLDNFGDDSIHFRLLLPPEGVDPEWPRLAENGSTVWPKGERTLHRPAYTIRWMDVQAGLLDFDIFIHEGGRATEWARQLKGGDQVTFTGPGGGGIPQAAKILLYADETGFPAAARILEALPARAEGKAVFLADPGKGGGYPVDCPAPGVSLRWTERGQGATLTALALADQQAYPDHFLWFASEKSEVQPVRAAYRAARRDPAKAYMAGYWTRPAGAES